MAGSCNLQKDNQRLTLPLAERIQKYLEYRIPNPMIYGILIQTSLIHQSQGIFTKRRGNFQKSRQSVHRL